MPTMHEGRQIATEDDEDYQRRYQQAAEHVRGLGITADEGQIRSYAQGRSDWSEFEGDQATRAASTDHRPYDSQTTNPYEQEMNRRADAAHRGGSQSPTSAWNSQPSSGGGGGGGGGGGVGNDFLNLLMQRIQQGTAVDRTDPNVRAQTDAYRANQERSRRSYLGDLAERAGPLANIQGEERMSAERMGQSVGAFESELIGREIAARRDEISQTLQLYGSMLSNQQRMDLERELALLNDRARTADRELGRRGQDLGFDQFLRELALRQWGMGLDDDYRWALV